MAQQLTFYPEGNQFGGPDSKNLRKAIWETQPYADALKSLLMEIVGTNIAVTISRDPPLTYGNLFNVSIVPPQDGTGGSTIQEKANAFSLTLTGIDMDRLQKVLLKGISPNTTPPIKLFDEELANAEMKVGAFNEKPAPGYIVKKEPDVVTEPPPSSPDQLSQQT